MIILKRVVVGPHRLYNLRPVIQVIIDGQLKFTHKTASGYQKFSKDVIPVNKNFEVGPVKKKQTNIEVKLFSDRSDAIGYENEYTISGKIYDLWKNGYKPKDPENFVDVAFSWRDEPKSENKEKPKSG